MIARVKSVLTHKTLLNKLFEEEKLKGVLEMAGAVCHEMNQPLQVIYGYAKMLTKSLPEDDPKYNYVTEINEHAERMGQITNKLMNITRYETRDYVRGKKIVDIDKASHTD